MNEESEDKYNLRDLLVANKGFSPKMLKDLTHHIDILIKIEYMVWVKMSD